MANSVVSGVATNVAIGTTPAIEVQHLRKAFHQGEREVVALADVSFQVEPGEIFGVMGLSGAGKSTLIRCINRLERPDAGLIRVAGQEITRLRGKALMVARRRIGMIFQQFNLLASRTVAGNVAFPLEIAGWSHRRIRERVATLLELVGLSDWAHAYPSQLSGGQKQRVGIARALAPEPVVLLSDEATSALDPETTLAVLDLLGRINQQMGLTILMITHEMQVIREICHRVGVIDHGRLVEVGPVGAVFSHPRSEMAQRLLRAHLSADVPADLLARPQSAGSRLLRLTFLGEVAQQPIVAQIARELPVQVNILYGRIDRLGQQPWGRLVVELSGQPAAVVAACAQLRQLGVEVEELRPEPQSDVESHSASSLPLGSESLPPGGVK